MKPDIIDTGKDPTTSTTCASGKDGIKMTPAKPVTC